MGNGGGKGFSGVNQWINDNMDATEDERDFEAKLFETPLARPPDIDESEQIYYSEVGEMLKKNTNVCAYMYI